ETSSTHGGSGLGLSICKNLVELMGGDIYFKSVEGEGSTFYFTLPLQKVTSGSSQRHYTPNLKEKRILVVDDHNFNRYIFQKQLEKIGADVVTVEDGPSAITALKDAALNRTPYDLAILDQNMPNMTGEELAEYLRVESIHPPIKLVLASSENISSNIAHYKELGFDSVFVKPVQESKLLNSVSRLLSEKTISSPSMELQELDILLVEDNLINQVFTQGTLKKHVKSVTIANNGVEAVEHFKKQTFSLILMDAQMPEMDGCEATKNIRLIEKAEGLSPLPIIGLTAGADEQNRSNCLQAGMNEVLLKPIDAIDLIAKIHEYAIEETESTPKKQKQN
ncbi:MAG: response regulator, partial [Alphaproteobacteria bacterium]|nr:response regulator [Alphaproteobacteria bacterium]